MTILRSAVLTMGALGIALASMRALSPANPSQAPSVVPLCAIPVARLVVDGFRPPLVPWGTGNRGLTYETEPGLDVRSVTRGVVVFAGRVGGSMAVSIQVDSEKRLTYSYLSSIVVRSGQQVSIGAIIGLTGIRPFQLGLRDDIRYFDPTPLVAQHCGHPRVILVPIPNSAN